MCYRSNMRTRTCRFGPVVLEKKVRHACVFCGYTRSKRFHWKLRPCPALQAPGYIIIEPDKPVERYEEFDGIRAGYAGTHIAQVWIKDFPEEARTPV